MKLFSPAVVSWCVIQELLSLSLDADGGSLEVEKYSSKFRHYLDLSESYHVYHTVHQFIVRDHTHYTVMSQ